MSDNLSDRLQKKNSGKFTYEDLTPYAQANLSESAAVAVLPVGKWVRVGNYWLLCKKVGGNMDDAYVHLVFRPVRRFLNWLLLLFAKRDKGRWIIWGGNLPHSDIVIDVWYVGDGTPGIALAAINTH